MQQVQMPARRTILPTDFPRAQAALRRHGILLEPSQSIKIYDSKKQYAEARYERVRRDGKKGISPRIFRYALRLMSAGMVDPQDQCTIHVNRRSEIIFLHESIHAHDLAKRPDMIQTLEKAGTGTSSKHDKKAQFAVIALLEGRAKFFERVAVATPEFSLIQKVALLVSSHLERIITVGFACAIVHATVDVYAGVNALVKYASKLSDSTIFLLSTALIVNTLIVPVCTIVTKSLLPYTAGLRFMEQVYTHFNKDAEKTMRITLRYPPTFEEIIRPSKYFKRIPSFL